VIQLHPVPHADLDAGWAIAQPWLAQACARPGCDLDLSDLRTLVDAERALLVLIMDGDRPVAAGVTQTRETESGARSCCILAVGGTGARAWRDTLREIEAGAARLGCARVEFVGRAGWAALLPDYSVDAYFVKHLGV